MKNKCILLLFLALFGLILVTPVSATIGKIAFASGSLPDSLSLYVIPNYGSTFQLTSTSTDFEPAWSPDGTKIAYTHQDPNYATWIIIMNADGTGVKEIKESDSIRSPTWSVTSEQIAYAAMDGIHIYDLATDTVIPIFTTGILGITRDPAWSPNGLEIAFSLRNANYTGAPYNIFKIKSDGSKLTQLTDNSGNNFEPSWWPLAIAFSTDRDGNWNIYKMNDDGTDQIQLTSDPSNDRHPSWSVDWTTIAFETDRDGNYEIYTMNSDGSSQTRVTNNPGPDIDPDYGISYPPLTIVSTNPAGGTYGVPANIGEITVTFSEPIYYDPTSYHYVHVDYDSNQLPVSISVRNENTLVINTTLAGWTYYTIHIAGVRSQSDGMYLYPGYEYDFYFHTASTDPAPTVASTSPLNGASDVQVDVTITAIMDESINRCIGSVTMVDHNNNPVELLYPDQYFVSDDYLNLSIYPAAPLISGETYTVTIQGLDHQDIVMEAPYSWSFSIIQPPVANAGPDQTVIVNENVQFDGSGSTDAGYGTIVNYAWNFGDTKTGSGVMTSHVYSAAGTYTVNLTVTDNDGLINTDPAVITVKTTVETTKDMITQVKSLGLPAGIETGFTAKLNAAIAALDKGNEKTAINNLNLFISQVKAQQGKKLTAAQADELIATAQRIIASIPGK